MQMMMEINSRSNKISLQIAVLIEWKTLMEKDLWQGQNLNLLQIQKGNEVEKIDDLCLFIFVNYSDELYHHYLFV